jgi:two-component system, NtrC family, sensor kinase
LSSKGAKRRTRARGRSTATKARTRVGRIHEPRAELERKLAEALEQQTATSEVLRVISGSPGELEPVFQAMLANAVRICEAAFGTLFLRDADAFRAVAMHNAPPAYAEARKREPLNRRP